MLDSTELETPQTEAFCAVETISDDIFSHLSISGTGHQADVSVADGETSNLSMLGEFLLAAGSALRTLGDGIRSNNEEHSKYVVVLGENDKPGYVLAPMSSQLDTGFAGDVYNGKFPREQIGTPRLTENRYPHLPVGAKPLESPPNRDSDEETLARIRALMNEQTLEQERLVQSAPQEGNFAIKAPSPRLCFPELNPSTSTDTEDEEYQASFQWSNWEIFTLSILPIVLVFLADYSSLLLLVVSAFTTYAAAYTVRSVAKPFI